MGKTLFWYIFKDLLKVFLLASGAIAGIMSFAGLLRPLTQHGLDLRQVVEMLGYFLPAMTNYSWPVAALFATTFVYGRLAADNELTALRATGVSYLAMLLPAVVLGGTVCLLSLAFLFFVVPESFLRAEQVVYSNLARFVSNKIERTQQIAFDSGGQKVTVFGQRARVLDPDPGQPRRQAVRLDQVAVVTYRKDVPKDEPPRPDQFFLARAATAFIDMPASVEGDVMLSAVLEGGAKIPRSVAGPAEAGAGRGEVLGSFEAQGINPMPMPSPVRETPRFMDLNRLLDLLRNPEHGRRVATTLRELVRDDQQAMFLEGLRQTFTTGDRTVRLTTTDARGRPDTQFVITAGANVREKPPTLKHGKLTVRSGSAEYPGVRFEQVGGLTPFTAQVRQIVIQATPDPEKQLVHVSMDLSDVVVTIGDERNAQKNLVRLASIPMPPEVAGRSAAKVRDYLPDNRWTPGDRTARLAAAWVRQTNGVYSELHGRFSFAVSCLVLVLVGAAVGMLFRSGNFVSAFAVSVIPAMVCIVLIVTGQHVAENVPRELPTAFKNPLELGRNLLWAGNVAVLIAGVALYAKLSRT